jgi:hypothetical protein
MAKENSKDPTTNAFENQAVAIAEQLGRIAGTVEGTAEQWLNRQAIAEQLTRVRDSASQLIESLAGSAAKGRQAAVTSAQSMSGPVRDAATKAVSAASSAVSSLASSVGKTGRTATKPSSKKTTGRAKSATANLDRAHAPGKKHRKAPPSVHGAKHSDEQIPKLRTAAAARQRRKSYA